MKQQPNEQLKQDVRAFWDSEPCGTGEPTAEAGSPEFFAQLELERYRREPVIKEFAAFETHRGQRVLEVGCGAGTDSLQWVRAGARHTGLDLSLQSIRMARRHLGVHGLTGKFCEGDAERLPFADNSFDVVYSWGVIHHTPNMRATIKEIHRVLRPGGVIRIMIYHRLSWVTWRLWVRHGLLAGRPGRSLHDVLAHHMESPGTQAYRRGEARELFNSFNQLEVRPSVTPYDAVIFGDRHRWLIAILRLIVRATGVRVGWFVGLCGAEGGGA
jgi:SAM-dependent methyltransferase